MSIPDLVGWVGTVCIVSAYYLVSTKKVAGDSTKYQVLNLVGAVGIIINTFTQRAWPAMTLNVIWAIIAAKTLLGGARQGESGRRE